MQRWDAYDHLDCGSIMKLKDKVGRFFVPLGVGRRLLKWGVKAESISEHDGWEEIEFAGLALTCAPARHFSGRGLTDRDSMLWCLRGQRIRASFCRDWGKVRII